MRIGIDIDGVLTNIEQYVTDNFIKYCFENNIEYTIGESNYEFYKSFNISKEIENDFHARFSAKRKTYEYRFYVSEYRNALLDRDRLRIYNVDIDKMKKATVYFLGKHSFKGFCSTGSSVKDFEREIYNIMQEM